MHIDVCISEKGFVVRNVCKRKSTGCLLFPHQRQGPFTCIASLLGYLTDKKTPTPLRPP